MSLPRNALLWTNEHLSTLEAVYVSYGIIRYRARGQPRAHVAAPYTAVRRPGNAAPPSVIRMHDTPSGA